MIRTIKRYSNRKLYDMTTSSYVTLNEILNFISDDDQVKIIDNVNKKDITSQVLLQAIFQKEKSLSENSPKNELLHEVIRRHKTFTGAYLKFSLDLR